MNFSPISNYNKHENRKKTYLLIKKPLSKVSDKRLEGNEIVFLIRNGKDEVRKIRKLTTFYQKEADKIIEQENKKSQEKLGYSLSEILDILLLITT